MLDLKLGEMTEAQLEDIDNKLREQTSGFVYNPSDRDQVVRKFWGVLREHVRAELAKRKESSIGRTESDKTDDIMQDLRKTAEKAWDCSIASYEEQRDEITEHMEDLEAHPNIFELTRDKDIVETLRIAKASVQRDIDILKKIESVQVQVSALDV